MIGPPPATVRAASRAEPELTFGVERFEADVQRDPTQAHGEAQPVQQAHAVPHHRGRQQQRGHFLKQIIIKKTKEMNKSEKELRQN